MRSIGFDIPNDLRKGLDDLSALERVHPYKFFDPEMQGMISGGTSVLSWAPARVYAPPSRDPMTVKTQVAKN